MRDESIQYSGPTPTDSGPEFSWISHCYDIHPDTGQLLVAEKRHLMARSYEYDVPTKAKRKLSFAREYMFYLKRDFANSLLRRKPYLTFKEPQQQEVAH